LVRHIECHALGSEADVQRAVAESLDLDIDNPTWADLRMELAGRHCLLVFDGCETVRAVGKPLQGLHDALDGLRILVTSRERLGVSAERALAVGPLGADTDTDGVDDGVNLFLAGAALIAPEVVINTKEHGTVAKLVDSLGHVPLAVLLAAGQLRAIPLHNLSDTVGITAGAVLDDGRNGRHSNFRRVVQESFQLLPVPQRDLAIRLSVFQGGFYLDDALKVLDKEAGLIGQIGPLIDSSLIVSRTENGRLRFRMLDSVRDGMAELAGPDMVASLRQRHAEHFTARAAELRQASDAGDWGIANAILRLEAGNFRAAHDYACTVGSSVLLRKLAASLARPYLESGATAEFDRLVAHGDRKARDANDLTLRLEIAGLLGTKARRERNFVGAKAYWLERADLAEAVGDLNAMADSLLDVADLSLQSGELDIVEDILRRVMLLGSGLTSMPLRTGAQILDARIRHERGNTEAARAIALEVEEAAETVEDLRDAMYAWLNLARLCHAYGDLRRADVYGRRMLRIAIQSGYVHYAGQGLIELGRIADSAGSHVAAALAWTSGSLIPSSASPSVRAEALRLLVSHSLRHPTSVRSTPDWQELADEFLACPLF